MVVVHRSFNAAEDGEIGALDDIASAAGACSFEHMKR